MNIELKELQPTKIVINYYELKAELEKNLEVYKGIVVTEETLAGSKATQKELANLRVKIEGYRKEKKKDMEEPVKSFDKQCKELIAMVESVEKPIKEGIKVFDDQKREKKREIALELIKEVVNDAGLNDKYAEKLDVLDKYMNLTATQKAVKDDLETRAFALKVEQDRESERIEIINSVIDSENSRLNTKLQIDLWKRDIEGDVPTNVIIQAIKAQAALVYDAENKPKEQEKVEQHTETPQHEEKAVNEPETKEKPIFKVTFDVIGDYETQHKVSDFLKSNGIAYKVVSQVKA